VTEPRIQPPFRRILIANRGEIALRIIRACRELDIQTVAVYSDADADALHVRAADESYRVGPAPAAASYLVADAIIAAAIASGAEAIHPGYGFLSEQAAFAAAVEAQGIVFVGPTPETLAGLGDKIAARGLARANDVPIVPGTFEPIAVGGDGDEERIAGIARDIGYPVLVKAAAGGGGRGMRRVDAPAELSDAVTAAAGEALQSFGSASVYLEHYVEGGRHIEVQLLGDTQGNIVALGERDCSIQRRHQKLVEEAPAPGLTPDDRRRIHGLAVRVARSVGLRNAATAEFLVTPSGEAYFLEVNARLQVEHGVTELVSGIDLVHEQLWIAAGHPLSERVMEASTSLVQPDLHAIELRISAEDPARAFAPTPGRIGRWREPAGPGVRVDSGAEEGMTVSAEYDPVLSKVLVVAPDRDGAIRRARRAVAEMETGGIQTTLPFHAWLLRHPAFVSGALRTDLVDRDWDPTDLREAAARRAIAAVAHEIRTNGSAVSVSGSGDLFARVPGAASGHPMRTDRDWAQAARREATERWP
jgi:acetyl/propionyl-CoA carboxylase alpha subunit